MVKIDLDNLFYYKDRVCIIVSTHNDDYIQRFISKVEEDSLVDNINIIHRNMVGFEIFYTSPISKLLDFVKFYHSMRSYL
jgi:hypothetical protein